MAHILRHASQPFLLAHQAMQFVERLHDGANHHIHHGVGFRHLGIEHLDSAFLTLEMQRVREVLITGDARGIEREQEGPGAILVLHSPQQCLEAGALVILAGFNRVLEGFNDGEVAGLRQCNQFPALRVEAHIVAILARSQVEGCAVHDAPKEKVVPVPPA
nr:hypothetical protein [Sulfuritalea hydrogenivorans]